MKILPTLLLAALLTTACEPPPAGEVEAVPQALTGSVRLIDSMALHFGLDTRDEWVIYVYNQGVGRWFPNVTIVASLQGWWNGGWTNIFTDPSTPIATSTNQIATGEACNPFTGCNPIITTVVDWTIYRTDTTVSRSVGWARRAWRARCPNGTWAPQPIAIGPQINLATEPGESGGTLIQTATTWGGGVFYDPWLWRMINEACGLGAANGGEDPFVNREYSICNGLRDHTKDRCIWWPGSGSCTPQCPP